MKNFQFLFNSMSPFSTKKVSGSELHIKVWLTIKGITFTELLE